MYKQIDITELSNRPAAWKNMIIELTKKNKISFDKPVPFDIIDEELKKFDAKYTVESAGAIPVNRKYFLEFNTEQGYIHYLLVWG